MEKVELKPCPFCGYPAEVHVERHGGKQYDYAYVECSNCNAKIQYEIDVEYSAFDRAVEEWNARSDIKNG
ncbi:MAG: Lar family restriction alleviation protein [Oscillospiraceae bacterium]